MLLRNLLFGSFEIDKNRQKGQKVGPRIDEIEKLRNLDENI